MPKYNSPIHTLLEQQTKHAGSATFFLTGYIYIKKPLKEPLTKELVAAKVVSPLIQALRENRELKHMTRLHERVRQAVEEKIFETTRLEHGIAIFIPLYDAAELERGRSKEIESDAISLLFTSRRVVNETHLGETYDLDQLLWLDAMEISSLVLRLDQQEAWIYSLTDSGLTTLKKMENHFWTRLDPGEKEYQEVHRPTGNKENVYSTGGDNVARTRKHANKLFAGQISSFTADLIKMDNYKFLVVFHSETFADLIDDLIKEASITSDVASLAVAKNLDSDEEAIKQEAMEKIKSFQKNDRTRDYNLALEKHALFVSGWSGVARASRMSKIDTLYIQPKAKTTGYLYQNELVYMSKRPNTRRTKNAAPWIVNSVINSGGKVVIMKELSMKGQGPIAAVLRY